MLKLQLKTKNIAPAIIRNIAGALKKSKILVLPTDTIYGLSCLASDAKAIRRIKKLKGNGADKPLIVLVSDFKMLKKYVFVSSRQEAQLKKYWLSTRRPTTVILRHRGRLPRVLTGKSDGLAVRLPKSELLIKIGMSAACPLVSTSLNLSGHEPLTNLKNLASYFPNRRLAPDLVVDIGSCRRAPSRLIDLRDAAKPIFLRK